MSLVLTATYHIFVVSRKVQCQHVFLAIIHQICQLVCQCSSRSIHPSTHILQPLPVHLPIHHSFHPSVHPSLHLSSIILAVPLTIPFFFSFIIYPYSCFVHSSLHPPIPPSIIYSSANSSIHQPVHQRFSTFFQPSLILFIHQSVYFIHRLSVHFYLPIRLSINLHYLSFAFPFSCPSIKHQFTYFCIHSGFPSHPPMFASVTLASFPSSINDTSANLPAHSCIHYTAVVNF